MSLAKDFQELIVWQKSHQLALLIYKITESFPQNEQFGLTSQLRRAAVSIPSNIAEGFERNSDKDFSHFLVIARGSASEVRAQIILARDLHYVTHDDYEKVTEYAIEIGKMINAFRKSLMKPGLAN